MKIAERGDHVTARHLRRPVRPGHSDVTGQSRRGDLPTQGCRKHKQDRQDSQARAGAESCVFRHRSLLEAKINGSDAPTLPCPPPPRTAGSPTKSSRGPTPLRLPLPTAEEARLSSHPTQLYGRTVYPGECSG